jgi:hypothetical protein
MSRQRTDRGFALAAAVFALVVIATLIAGAFFAARQEISVGRSSSIAERAFAAAEAGLNQTIATWNTASYNALSPGDSAVTPTTAVPDNGGSFTVTVLRLNPELFLVRSLGRDPSGSAQRLLATLARLQRININIQAGLTTRGEITLGGSSFTTGADAGPSGWGCPSSGLDTLPGVLTRDSSQISLSGCKNYSCVEGDPKVRQDTSINDSTFFKFGEINYDELAAMATLQLPGGLTWTQVEPSDSAGMCRTWYNKNWGEPSRGGGTVSACYNYFPIIHINGSASFSNGKGQGILLVDGNVNVQGGFEFNGPVIVRGEFDTQGTGNKFTGGVLAANATLQESNVLGNATVAYSSCAVARAQKFGVPARELARRNWADLIQ